MASFLPVRVDRTAERDFGPWWDNLSPLIPTEGGLIITLFGRNWCWYNEKRRICSTWYWLQVKRIIGKDNILFQVLLCDLSGFLIVVKHAFVPGRVVSCPICIMDVISHRSEYKKWWPVNMLVLLVLVLVDQACWSRVRCTHYVENGLKRFVVHNSISVCQIEDEFTS